MKSQTFVIKSHDQITSVISFLHSNYNKANFENKPLVVRVGQKQDDRSTAQNKLYWKWLTQWANHQGSDKDTEHLFFKRKFLSVIYFRDDVGQYRATFQAVKKLKDEKHPLYNQVASGLNELISTADASVRQFTEYLNDIHAFCNKQGCWLETPEDLMYTLE